MAGVGIGTMALICVLSVMNGFGSHIRLILDFRPRTAHHARLGNTLLCYRQRCGVGKATDARCRLEQHNRHRRNDSLRRKPAACKGARRRRQIPPCHRHRQYDVERNLRPVLRAPLRHPRRNGSGARHADALQCRCHPPPASLCPEEPEGEYGTPRRQLHKNRVHATGCFAYNRRYTTTTT